jgi:hypothetical protein
MTEEQIGMDSIDNIGMTEVTILFSQIDEPVPDDLETARIKISELGKRRHLGRVIGIDNLLNSLCFCLQTRRK